MEVEYPVYPDERSMEREENEMSNPSKSKGPAVNIQRSVYTMATTDGSSAEIVMYGDIYEEQPVDWWTGKPVEGKYILLSEFLDDLEQIAKCKSITIRMNSYGGDAGVSNTIHNRLRELARNGAELICVVDGVAMSGGSLIMCACDTVRVNPSSLIMIHKCWSYIWGDYNADELRQMADQNDAWDKMQITIYKRKTGLSDTVLSHMMADTTYMTGKEAVDKGFADEVLEDAEPLNITASVDGRSLFVRGRTMRMEPGTFAPDTIPTVNPEACASVTTDANQPEVTGGQKGGNSMTKEEFRMQYPDLFAEVQNDAIAAGNTGAVNAAIQAEQARLQGIDEIAGLFDDALVKEAKYGEKACNAAELALRAAQNAAKQGRQFLSQLDSDSKDANTGDVGAAPGVDEPKGDDALTPEARMAKTRAEIKSLLGKKKEG